MRISNETVKTLIHLSNKYFGKEAELRLFGSRLNDAARGGDIDVHVIAPNATFKDEIAFLVEADQLFDERIDIRLMRDEELLIDKIAIEKGVILNDQLIQKAFR